MVLGMGANAFAIQYSTGSNDEADWPDNFQFDGQLFVTDKDGDIIEESTTELNDSIVAPGTAEKVAELEEAFKAGTVKVFDTSTFTVNGETVTTYLADVDDLGDYVGETEAISDGVFLESFYRSAPYFDLDIDGITNLDA